MESFYSITFGALALFTALTMFYEHGTQKTSSAHAQQNQLFARFRNNYLTVFSLMMAGDWLQGPYVYRLYEYYGFDVGAIGQLFIAGFGSSFLFGTIVGSLADKYGRRKAALLYVVLYSLSCATKHFNNYQVLMFGRVLGGIATSLLWSAFESWVVAEHIAAGFDPSWLSEIFSKATFLGNGLMAVLSGLLANFLVENLNLGPVAPFDAAAVVLLLGGAIILVSWGENKGSDKGNTTMVGQFQDAFGCIMKDQRVALLGAIQSLFEASMYSFVFLWTPALSPNGERIPHGFIFACLLISCMPGAAFAGMLMKKGARPEKYLPIVLATSALMLGVPAICHSARPPSVANKEMKDVGIQFDGKVQLVCFCLFEAMVGIFWPSMMAMRARFVPEELRSTIINIFRIPLNLFVCLILARVNAVPLAVMFGVCAGMLVTAMLCQLRLQAIINTPASNAGGKTTTGDADLPHVKDDKEPLLTGH